MDTNTLPALTDADDPILRLAVAAHLARYKGQSRAHTASDQAIADRTAGPILLNRYARRMDRHAATRRLRTLARSANVTTARMHPHCCATRS